MILPSLVSTAHWTIGETAESVRFVPVQIWGSTRWKKMWSSDRSNVTSEINPKHDREESWPEIQRFSQIPLSRSQGDVNPLD